MLATPSQYSVKGDSLPAAERTLRLSQLKERLALAGVTEELKTLSELTQQPVMENAGFSLDAFKQSVNQGHFAVYIAS